LSNLPAFEVPNQTDWQDIRSGNCGAETRSAPLEGFYPPDPSSENATPKASAIEACKPDSDKMDKTRDKSKPFLPRIELTAEFQDRLNAFKHKIPETARLSGLPYLLVYNVVHGRVRSLSAHDYRKLFREAPPLQQKPRKVDGTFFRQMVRLWSYLNDGATQAGLYRELFDRRPTKRVDYRIFTGQVKTVSPRLESAMLEKFAQAGLDRPAVKRWIEAFESQEKPGRVDYQRIRPILLFLQTELNVNPSAILNQPVARYESGYLQSVSSHIYDRATALKAQVELAISSGRRYELDRLRDRVYRGRSNYTLYSKIEEELLFLMKYGGKSAKYYLGRGKKHYEQGKSKRIASWRAEKIIADSDALIWKMPDLPLAGLPRSQRGKWIGFLLASLTAGIAERLSTQEGLTLEKRILQPRHEQAAYNKPKYGFTEFEMASRALGMKKKAFDLMVARNCEIFRDIGKYRKRWYLPNLYLTELYQREYFNLISIKYEMMAKQMKRSGQANECLH
jgi:hypothetical protein